MINTLPLVSVIVLIYKRFDDLFKTLDSVLKQSYGKIEIIIADDGSDNYFFYEKEMKEYFRIHKKTNIYSIIYKHEISNVGTVKNCNNAIRICQGKYVKFISPGDELFDEKVLENSILFAEKHNSKIVIGQTFQKRRNGFDGDIIKNTLFYRWRARGGRRSILVPSDEDISKIQKMSEEEKKYLIMTKPFISTVAVLFSKELLKETDGFNEDYRLIEDMPFWPTVAQKNVKFDFINLIMMKYSMSGISNRRDSHSHSPFELDRRSIIRKYYIANMRDGALANNYKKLLKERELDFLDAKGIFKLLYLDVWFLIIYRRVKYLLTGSRI